MKRQILTFVTFGLIMVTACKDDKNQQMNDVEIWQLGWRMIGSSMEENYELASLQFDSLRSKAKIIDSKYLVTGLEAKNAIGNIDEIIQILNSQDRSMLQEICGKQFLSGLEPCDKYSKENIGNKELQIELIKMYVDDQVVRGNMMKEMITKYQIDTIGIKTHQDWSNPSEISVDDKNRNQLKQIIEKYGFPTKSLVGKDAMQGIFLIIQHSDGDREWQKSQLTNIENAVKKGDMDGQNYAYLYDRIKINSGEKQLYGTQFAKVDPVNKTVELAETEDVENLDRRRMEIGMMPIKMYKEFMLENL